MKRGDVVMFLKNRRPEEIRVGAIGIVLERDRWPETMRPLPNGVSGKYWVVDDGHPDGPVLDVRPEDVEVLP